MSSGGGWEVGDGGEEEGPGGGGSMAASLFLADPQETICAGGID